MDWVITILIFLILGIIAALIKAAAIEERAVQKRWKQLAELNTSVKDKAWDSADYVHYSKEFHKINEDLDKSLNTVCRIIPQWMDGIHKKLSKLLYR